MSNLPEEVFQDGLAPYVPPPHNAGWSNGTVKLGSAPQRDPDLARKLTVPDARRIIGELEKDRVDAGRFGAAQQRHVLDTLFKNRGGIFDRFLANTPTYADAYAALDAATRALAAANEVPCSIDRATAVERENTIVWCRNVLRVREVEFEAAKSLAASTNQSLGDAFVLIEKKNSPRNIARTIVARIVDAAHTGNIRDEDVEQPCEESARAWEPVWIGRALETYEPGADGLPIEALRVAFEARRDPAGARRAWMRAQISSAKKRKGDGK